MHQRKNANSTLGAQNNDLKRAASGRSGGRGGGRAIGRRSENHTNVEERQDSIMLGNHLNTIEMQVVISPPSRDTNDSITNGEVVKICDSNLSDDRATQDFEASPVIKWKFVKLVCCFCRAFEGTVYFQVNAGNESELVMTNVEAGIYILLLNVPLGVFKGTLSYKKRGGEEKIYEKIYFNSYLRFSNDRRDFHCDTMTTAIQILSRDCYFSGWRSMGVMGWHEMCTDNEYSRGCARLITYMAKSCINMSIPDYFKILCEITIPSDLNSGKIDEAKVYWNDLSKDISTDNNDPELLIKRILLINRLKLVSSTLNLGDVLHLAVSHNADKVFGLIFGADQDIVNITCQFFTFLVQLFSRESLPWSVVLLALKKYSNPAEKLLAAYPQEIVKTLTPFHLYLDDNALAPILKNLQSIRALKDVSIDRKNKNSGYLMASILSSQKYYKPKTQEEKGAEFQAILYFVEGNTNLLYDILLPDTKEPFTINAIGHLPMKQIAVDAVFPVLKSDVEPRFKKRRVDEFKQFIQNKIDNIDTAEILYSIITLMMQSLPHCDDYIADIHAILPATPGPGLTSRLIAYAGDVIPELLELERNALKEICCLPCIEPVEIRYFLLNDLMTTSRYSSRLVELLVVTWWEIIRREKNEFLSKVERKKILFCVYKDDEPLANDLTILVLCSDSVGSAYVSVEEELTSYPWLAHDQFYSDIYLCRKTTAQSLSIIAAAISEGMIFLDTLQVFISNVFLVNNLTRVEPSFDPTSVQQCKIKAANIRKEWEDLLVAFRDYMPQHPKFQECSKLQTMHCEEEMKVLDLKPINQWSSPSLGGKGMRELAEILQQAQSSRIYQWLWQKQCQRETDLQVSDSPEDAVILWKDSIDHSIREWKVFVQDISRKDCEKLYLLEALSTIIEDEPACPEIPNDALQARDVTTRHFRQVAQHRFDQVQSEVEITFRVLGGMQGVERASFGEVLSDYLSAAAFKSQAIHLLELSRILNCKLEGNDPLVEYCRVMSADEGKTLDVISSFNSVKHRYPTALHIQNQFPGVLLTLIKEGGAGRGLLNLFQRFVSKSLLNQMVARIITEVPATTHVLLVALQQARDAFELKIREFDCYSSFCQAKMQNLDFLFEYLTSVGWCISGLRRLINGIDTIFSLLDDGLSGTSTIRIVHALMFKGDFIISLPEAKLSAVYVDGEGNTKELNTVELGDIPFQLCLTGSTSSNNDDESDQKHFLIFIELMSSLRDVLLKLSTAGHPEYQESKLIVPGSETIENLVGMLEDERQVLLEWQYFLINADTDLPLLSCLSRKQLVDSIRLIAQRDDSNNALSALLRSVYPVLSEQETKNIVIRYLQQPYATDSNDDNLNAKKLSVDVHDLLKRAVNSLLPTPVQLISKINFVLNIFKAKVPDKLLNPGTVTVLWLPKKANKIQTEVSCALYIARFARLPSSVEIFPCSAESTELAVTDFIRCWASSETFLQYLPMGKRKMMFCLLNVEQLKPSIQNCVLAKIHAHRRMVNTPLVILASTDNEMDSLLCAGLRGDWITSDTSFVDECRPLLSAFLAMVEPLVQVYSSQHPSSGKTIAILENFVVSVAGTNKTLTPYARIPISGNIDEAVNLLSLVERDRQLANESNIVLHLNISNSLDIDLLNRFFLSYLIIGVLVDSNGRYIVRNRADSIVIEWPSEGVIATKAASLCGLSSSFIQKQVTTLIYFHEYIYTPCVEREHIAESVLYYVERVDDEELKLGTQMMQAFFDVPRASFTFPYRESISKIQLPSPVELFNFILAKIHFRNHPLPSPGVVYRFHRFFAKQLIGLYQFPMYEMCTLEQEAEDTRENLDPASHCRNFRRLVYHFARCSYNLAVQLASEAVKPLTEEYVENDTRLEELTFSFTNWKNQKFLIFSSGSMPEMVSTSGDIFLQEISEGDSDPTFKRFLELQHRGVAGKTVHALCCQLSDPKYEPDKEQSEDHALRKLLLMIGDVDNFSLLVFEALRVLTGPNRTADLSPDQPITNLPEGALRELRNIIIQHQSHNADVKEVDLLGDDKLVGDFSNRARDWFKSICGSYNGSSPPFVLTVDNLVRLLAIKIRLACKIPVVLMGETGSGKTHVVGFYSRISGSLFEIVNVHGGMDPRELLQRILDIIQRAAERRVVILLDEVNSMPSVWTIKELVCERFIMGHRIPANVQFICIMNPRRRRLNSPESSGLDFSPYQAKRGVNVHEEVVATTPLVYEVHRSPESLMSLVWDFGNPVDSIITREEASLITHNRTPFPQGWDHVTDELLFAESMCHWMINSQLEEFVNGIEIEGRVATGLYYDFQTCEKADNEGVAHFRYLRALLCALLKTSQAFVRKHFHEISAASLRDIARTISLIPFIITVQQRFVQLNPALALGVTYLYFKFLDIAIQVTFTLNYGLRLGGTLRHQYFAELRAVWNLVRLEHKSSVSSSFMPVPIEEGHIYGAFDQFAISLCGALSMEDGMAINEALKENVTSLFCSIMGNQDTGIAQFIVGRPGSTKSSSLDILCSSTDPNSTDPRCKFFRAENWFEVRKFVLQCTPDTTAEDTIRVAYSAANYQSINSNCRCVIVLEEVGVTVGSPHNPLMVLHGLVDRGVLMSNGKYIRLPIVGVSNWRLDASKMNRMRTTHRGNASVDDLMQTAKCIMRDRASGGAVRFDRTVTDSLTRFAQTFSDYVLSDGNSSDDVKKLGWFYGMRDFYAFVQLLQMHHSYPLAREMGFQVTQKIQQVDPHLVRWATKIAFGGHPVRRLEELLAKKINDSFFPNSERKAQFARWVRKEAIGELIQERYLCDMCCRVDHYTEVKTSADILEEAAALRQLFSRNTKSVVHGGGGNCVELDTVDRFPTLKLLSYLLSIQRSNNNASFCRMRHVLIFTRANAALQLLHKLKIVRLDQVVVVFGRAEPTTRDILDDLLRVRRCMLSGRVLILVGASHIYESLYDALNQHYTVEGEGENRKYFTRLTMNGYTASFPMHETFRCIAIEQESTCQSLLPPFINRFAKALLNYSSALSIQQRNLARLVLATSIVQTDEGREMNILRLLIPGYTEDTVDSLALLFPTEQLKTGAEMQGAVEYAINQLGYLCAPRRLQQLVNGMYEGFTNDRAQEVIRKWNQSRTHSVLGDIAGLSQYRTEGFENYQHYFLLTEQRCLEFATVMDAVSEVIPGAYCSAKVAVDINTVGTEGKIIEFLKGLAAVEKESYLIAIFDSSFQNCAEQLERFLYLITSVQLGEDKHIFLIGMMKNSSIAGIPTDHYFLHLDSKWAYLFMDEISPSQEEWIQTSLEVLLDYENTPATQQISTILTPELFCYFVCVRALSIAQKIENSAKEIQRLQQDIVSTFGDYHGPANFIANRICEQLHNVESLNHGRWILQALRKVRQTDSLRQQLRGFLASLVERCILKYCTQLFGFGNFKHILSTSPLRRIYTSLVLSKAVFHQQDLSVCVLIDLPLIAEWQQTAVADSMFDDHFVQVAFPFSFVLYHVLRPYAETIGREGVKRKLDEIFENLVLTADEAEAYANDIFSQKGVRSVEQQNALKCLIKCLSSVSEAYTTIDGIHGLLESEVKLLDSAMRVVTNPSIRLNELISNNITAANLGESLLRAASDAIGIVSLGAIPDIVHLAGDSFSIRLHHAIAVGTAHSSPAEKASAAALAWDCHNDYQKLVAEFFCHNLVAISLSKYLLPVLYFSIPVMDKLQVFVDLLTCAVRNFDLFPLPALGFLITRTLHLWFDSNGFDANDRLFGALDDCLSQIGLDSQISVLFSRCVFDYCDFPARIAIAVSKASSLNNESLRYIIINGAITSAIDLICNKMRNISAENQEDFISDPEATELCGLIHENIFHSEYLITGATLFTLRSLSSGGIELDIAKAAIEMNERYLPNAIKTHRLVAELCVPKNIQNSIFGVFTDYNRSFALILSIFGQPFASPQHLNQFSQFNEIGRVVALLECGFCCVDERSLSDLNTLRQFINDIQLEIIQKLAHALLNPDLSPTLRLMPKELKRSWVCVVMMIITSPMPMFQYLNQMITRPADQIVPYPDIPADIAGKLAAHFSRFLHSSAALASATLHPQALVDAVELDSHRTKIFENILTSKCPVCFRVMDFWPGCFAVECECRGKFCGWCLTDTRGDAHPHVLVCPENLNPNSYHGTEVQYYQVRNKHKLQALHNYLNDISTPVLRIAVIGAILPNLNILNFPTDSLGSTTIGYSLDLSRQRLVNSANALKMSLFEGSLSDDPALIWLEGLLLIHLKDVNSACRSFADVQDITREAIHASGAANLFMEVIRARSSEAAEDMTTIGGTISWDEAYELSIQQLSDYQRGEAMPRHFAYRCRFTSNTFWNRVKNDESLGLFQFLSTHQQSLEAESSTAMIRVLRYMGDVIRICYSKQMTRPMANEKSLSSLAEEFDFLGGARMAEFLNDVNFIYDKVERYECKGYDSLEEAFGHLTFDGSIKLFWLLPRTSDTVTILPVLFKGYAPDGPNNPPITWRGLGLIQNDTVRLLQFMYHSPERTAENQTFQLSIEDVVTFDMQHDLLDNLPLYINPQPIATLTDDLLSLQMQIAHSSGLWGKPIIGQEIVEFQYSEDNRKSVFGKVADVLQKLGKQSQFPSAEVQELMNKALAHNPDFGPSCMEFLTIVAVELIHRPPTAIPHSLQELAESIAIPLTEEQQRGKSYLNSPLFGKELHVEHIVTVCALLWDGGVIPGAAVPLSEADTVQLTMELKELCQNVERNMIAPYLRIGLRLLGIQFLCAEQTPLFLSDPFSVYLEILMDNHFEDYLHELVLCRLPVAHFNDVFQIADEILKDVMEGHTVASDLGSGGYEVPLAMLRPIIHMPESVPVLSPVAPFKKPSSAIPVVVEGVVDRPVLIRQTSQRRSRWEGRGNIRQPYTPLEQCIDWDTIQFSLAT